MNHQKSLACLFAAILAIAAASSTSARADADQIERGKYLVTIAGCTDCHTPGHLLGKPDLTRYLGGSEVGFDVPGVGKFYGPNLTPDKATGLGGWTADQIVAAIQTGVRPDGRTLSPVMPFMAYANLTQGDAHAIAAYLQSIPLIANKAPGPFSAAEKATSFLLTISPP